MIISFFSMLLFAGLTAEVAERWQESKYECPHAPPKPNAELYCAACAGSLAGLAISAIAFLFMLVKAI